MIREWTLFCVFVFNFFIFAYSVKPALKKVSKYDGKLEKMAKVAAKAEMDFRNNLKRVQSTKFTMEEENKDVSKNVRVLGESLVVP